MAPNFAELKLEAFQMLAALEDADILARVRAILSEAQVDWWDDLSDEDKAALEEADQDIAAGRVLTHKQVKANLAQWLQE